MKTYEIHRMVKGEDLNHHGTLFASQGAKRFVESGFIFEEKALQDKAMGL